MELKWPNVEMTTALSAVVVGVAALIVAVDQSNIARQQADLMEKTVQASVWPVVQFDVATEQDIRTARASLSLRNSGVGPAIVKGIQIARKIAQTEPLRSHITEEHAPGAHVAFDDEEATLDWARRTSVTIYHPTGTCKMGVDPMAVLDPDLRVKGIKGLRVADASIMPQIVSGNTNAPAIMIGEKASDLVLMDAGQ